MVLGRIRRSMREDWSGTHVRQRLAQPWEGWPPELSGFTRALKWTSDSDVFVGRPGGFPRRIPDDENVDWVAMSIVKIA